MEYKFADRIWSKGEQEGEFASSKSDVLMLNANPLVLPDLNGQTITACRELCGITDLERFLKLLQTTPRALEKFKRLLF